MTTAIKFLTFNQTLSLIKAVGHKRTVLVVGENGIGKTALHAALKADPKFANHIAVDPIDCTQMSDGSVWMPDLDREAGISRELPNERFGLSKTNQKGVPGARPVLVFMDEALKCPQYIQNTIAPIVYDRRIGTYHFVEGSVVVIASNMAVEGLGDAIKPHLRSRLILVHMRKPTQIEWQRDFAIPFRLNATVIACTREHPEMFDSFMDYEPGGRKEKLNILKDNGMINNPRGGNNEAFVNPRSLHAASDIVNEYEQGLIDDETLEVALDGTIGPVARAFMASFIRFGAQITPIERVIADPEHAPLSDNPNVQMIQILKFVTQTVDRSTADCVIRYIERMRGEMQSMFCNEVSCSPKSIPYFLTNTKFVMMQKQHRSKFA